MQTTSSSCSPSRHTAGLGGLASFLCFALSGSLDWWAGTGQHPDTFPLGLFAARGQGSGDVPGWWPNNFFSALHQGAASGQSNGSKQESCGHSQCHDHVHCCCTPGLSGTEVRESSTVLLAIASTLPANTPEQLYSACPFQCLRGKCCLCRLY